MTIDLNTCVPGQMVRLRYGAIVEYNEPVNDSWNTPYQHIVDHCSYMNNGCFWKDKRTSGMDVIEILPLETIESTKDNKHPSVAWWKSCPWITNRQPTKEDGDQFNQVIMQVNNKSSLCFVYWEYVKSNEAWIHSLNWNPPTLTNKEKAMKLIDKHKEGWTPTLDEWIIIRDALKE